MKKRLTTDQKIPNGYQVYEDGLRVAGLSFQKRQAIAFARSGTKWIELQRDPGNKHDKNAIKVIGCSKRLLLTKRRFIGFVPRGVAKRVVNGGFWKLILPRLQYVSAERSGYVTIEFQLLGPKGRKNEYRPPKAENGYLDQVKQLRSEGNHKEAIEILLKLVDETEKEVASKKNVQGVASWCYKQLAMIYRKEKRYADEVAILERYASQPHAPGVTPEKMAERLDRARELLNNSRA